MDKETLRIKTILKRAWELAFDVAVRTMSIEEAQEQAWMKVAGSVKLMIESRVQPELKPERTHTKECLEKYTKFWHGVIYNPPHTPKLEDGDCICPKPWKE